MNSAESDRFENFRRERKRRRADAGPLRPMGKHDTVLRQIEEAEQREARNQRLTREVQDFFEEATRTAASIVSQVAQSAEQEQQVHVTEEMSEFLTETIQRAQMFVQMMQIANGAKGIAAQDVQPNIHNLVGQRLDEFRWAGNSEVTDPHIGLDPFKVDAQPAPQGASPAGDSGVREVEMPPEDDEHLASEYAEEERGGAHVADTGALAATASQWFERLAANPEKLKDALRALVHYDAMSKDEARAVWAACRS